MLRWFRRSGRRVSRRFIPTVTALEDRLVLSPPGSGWQLQWSDEFNGTSLDTSKWAVVTGARRDAVNTASAISVSGGYLTITTYTSGGTNYTGFIGTYNSFLTTYGYWEARINFEDSPGMWSAFWEQSPTIGNPLGNPAIAGTEIDNVEHRYTDGTNNISNKAESNLHWDGYGANEHSAGSGLENNPGSTPLEGNFHLYGFQWTPTGYQFFIDGTQVWSSTQAVSHRSEYIFLTSEVQNNSWAGRIPTGGYGSLATSTTKLIVDYVRVYKQVPVDWVSADIGGPAHAGYSAFNPANGTWTIAGGGSDIWGTADQFHLTSESWTGDGSVVARVNSLQNTDPWAKAGVMYRDGTAAGALFADVLATPGNGVTFQWRSTVNAVPSSVNVTGLSAPVWVQLVRSGNGFSASYSTDGVTWMPLGTTQTINMSGTVRAGLAVTAHNNGTLASATFTHVSVLPAGWTAGDIGGPGLAGSSVLDAPAGTWTVAGGGTDIWGTADQFQFASQNFAGDGSLVAQVTSVPNTNAWAKAGVMFRDNASPGAVFADVLATPGSGVSFQWRTTAGGTGNSVTTPGVTAPVWVRLARTGNTFSASYSTDGVTWNAVGTPQTIAMSSTALAGLAVTAHNNAALCAATFAHVSFLPAGWSDTDIGSPGKPGYADYSRSSGTWTVAGGGTDIWGTADQFHLASQSFTGDGSLTALVTGVQNTDPWAKAGVMFRAGTDPGAAFADVLATSGQGVSFQWRTTAGGTGNSVTIPGVTAPVWVRLVRTGNTFSAYYSTDAATWTTIGTPQTIALSPTVLAGLAVTAHNNGLLNTATFGQVIVAGPASQLVVATDAASPDVAGTPFDVTVLAEDANGNVDPTYAGTIHFTSADPYGATLPADYTFQPGDQGMATFAGGAVLYTAGTWDVTATDTASGIGGAALVNVQAAPAAALQVLAPASVSSGTPFTVTLIATDPYGNTDTNYAGTVAFSTSDGDPRVVLPPNYTFQPTDQGQATFPGGVTLITPGNETLTAADTASGIAGNATVIVTSGMVADLGRRGGTMNPLEEPEISGAGPAPAWFTANAQPERVTTWPETIRIDPLFPVGRKPDLILDGRLDLPGQGILDPDDSGRSA